MDEQLALYPHMKFNEIDMVFFPINAFEHFYIVCYGLKNPSMELIDNSKNCPDYKEKYQGRPEGLHQNFVRYLADKKHHKASEINTLTPDRLEMEWRTAENKFDCGIFVMRHMETYMGGGTANWNSGFHREGERLKNQLHRLRSIYCCQILTEPTNELAKEVIRKAQLHHAETAKFKKETRKITRSQRK
ncbi:uncharacterized protein LOC109832389 [Asparagus officinalis]|uniref:uncharacterized protein LOC109832389 n=3 Tax=Asparagus officinalis TaxID=4686 RepID=UPI00098E4610|nr:uncharacterized protein LOC109832389 [Asparagus officinalis]